MKKKRKKIIKIFILILGFASLILFLAPLSKIIFFALNKEMTKLITPQKIEFSVDHIYSTALKNNLIDFLNENTAQEKLATFNPKAFYKELKTNFKIIKKIEWNFTHPQIAKLKLQGAKPFCKINNKFILGNKKRLFNSEYFENFDIKNLNNVKLAQEFFDQKVNPNIYSFFNKISKKTWENYNLSYIKNWAIILQEKNKNNSIKTFFLFDKKNFFNSEKLERTNLLISFLKKNWGNRYFWQKTKLFDLRFKNRILYRPLKIKPWGRG